MKRSLVALSPIGLAVLSVACISSPDRTATGGKPYHGLIQYRAKDAKEAILEPVLLDPGEAIVAAGTSVIGVFINGEARAYPLFILNNHQH